MLRDLITRPGKAIRQAWSGHSRLVLLLVTGCLVAAPSARPAVPLEGQRAPEFVLKSLNGDNLRLSEFRGDVVMINFWASWCGACRDEMPILDEVFRRYKPIGFKLLSVNIDDDRERAVQISQSLGVSFPVLYDRRKKVSRKYEVTRMPSIILVDREGVVRHWHHGYDRATEERYLQQLRALLRE